MQCEVCEEVLASELAYCMHKDHHSVAGDAKFVCKGCQADCTSPCAFYRHQCSSPEVAWCPLCDKGGSQRGPGPKIEEIVIDDDDDEQMDLASEASSQNSDEQISFLDMLEPQETSASDDIPEIFIYDDEPQASGSQKRHTEINPKQQTPEGMPSPKKSKKSPSADSIQMEPLAMALPIIKPLKK